MIPGRPRPRFGLRSLLWLLAAGAVVTAFAAGPSGLVSIAVRRHQARRLERQIATLKGRIAEQSARRDWLADPDSAAAYARALLADDSTPR